MIKKNNTGKRVTTSKNGQRTVKYATLRMLFPSLPRSKCKKIAGYSPSSDTTKIEQSDKYRAMISPNNQRDALQCAPGTMMVDLVNRLRQVYEADLPDDIEVTAGNIISAIKETKDILGYRAPEQVEVTQRGLFLHLAGYSTDQLEAAYTQISGEQSV